MALKLEGLCPLIQVFDMPASLRFYRDLLGFGVAMQSSPGDECNWVLLRFDQVQLMLNTAYESPQRPPKPDLFRVAAHADTGLFIGCPDIDAAYDYLSGNGIELKKPIVTSYGMKQLYLQDPDGYGLCFQWPAA